MYSNKLLNIALALLLMASLWACEGEEEPYDWEPAGTLHIIGDDIVPIGASQGYRVDGFTIDNSYTWTLNGNAVEPTREGERVSISLPAPGDYELVVSNGTLEGKLTVAALPVSVGFTGSAASATEDSDTVSLPLGISYDEGTATPLDAGATVGYTLGGTAVAGEDYTLLSPNPLVVGGGADAATIQVVLLNNTVQEEARTITATLTSVATEGVTGVALPEAEAARTYTFTVTDDLNTISLAGPEGIDTLSSRTDAGIYTFEVLLGEASGSDVTVPYTLAGTGVNDLTEGEVTLLAGQATAEIVVEVQPEAFAADQTVSVTLGEVDTEDGEIVYETDDMDNPIGNAATFVIVAPE